MQAACGVAAGSALVRAHRPGQPGPGCRGSCSAPRPRPLRRTTPAPLLRHSLPQLHMSGPWPAQDQAWAMRLGLRRRGRRRSEIGLLWNPGMWANPRWRRRRPEPTFWRMRRPYSICALDSAAAFFDVSGPSRASSWLKSMHIEISFFKHHWWLSPTVMMNLISGPASRSDA